MSFLTTREQDCWVAYRVDIGLFPAYTRRLPLSQDLERPHHDSALDTAVHAWP